MWEHGSIVDGKPCEPKPIKAKQLSGAVCRICGQHLLPDEECFLIIGNAFEEARKLKIGNFPAHCTCWNEFSEGITENEELARKIKRHRTPKCVLTEEHWKRVYAFFVAGRNIGFWGDSTKMYKGGIFRIKKSGTSDVLEYCPVTDVITYRNSRRKGLFDCFYKAELLDLFRNAMNKELGLPLIPVKSANDQIREVLGKANQIVNRE